MVVPWDVVEVCKAPGGLERTGQLLEDLNCPTDSMIKIINMHMDVSGALQLLGIASLFWRRTFPLCLYSAMTQYTIQILHHSHKCVVSGYIIDNVNK